MVVREGGAGSAFAVAAVAVHGAFVAAGDGDADGAAVALGCFRYLGLAGHRESVTMVVEL